MASKMESGDYYIEDGRWVFTSQFLLRRKYCCKNNCRHCPYKKENICDSVCNQEIQQEKK